MSELNAEIARLMGWTGVRPGYFIPSAVAGVPPNGKDHVPVPAFDTDPGAALSCLEYVLRQKSNGGNLFVDDMKQTPGGQWSVMLSTRTGITFWGLADTLPAAIALACRNALAALAKAAEEDTPE